MYLHTIEGAAEALGLKEVNQVNYYVKKVVADGYIPSETKGGIEYFDVDALRGNYKKAKYSVPDLIKRQLSQHKNEKKFQLKLFDEF